MRTAVNTGARQQGELRGHKASARNAGEIGLCWKASPSIDEARLKGSVPFLLGLLVWAPVW